MNLHTLGHATRWLVFAAVAIAVSYLLRWLGHRSERAGEARVRAARMALGLAPDPPRDGVRDDTSAPDATSPKP